MKNMINNAMYIVQKLQLFMIHLQINANIHVNQLVGNIYCLLEKQNPQLLSY